MSKVSILECEVRYNLGDKDYCFADERVSGNALLVFANGPPGWATIELCNIIEDDSLPPGTIRIAPLAPDRAE